MARTSPDDDFGRAELKAEVLRLQGVIDDLQKLLLKKKRLRKKPEKLAKRLTMSERRRRRDRKVTPDIVKQAFAMRTGFKTIREISEDLGVHRDDLMDAMKKAVMK